MHLGLPVKFTSEPGSPDFKLPGLGEHNAAILTEAGYTDSQVQQLTESGALVSSTK